MSRADYAHWNEDADYMWWHEEGKHADSDRESSYEDDNREMDALDAFYEDVAEMGVEEIERHLSDVEYCAKWPKAVAILRQELADRGC